ncbi:MAG: hypothetical protein KDN22_14335 [Verrucomicrobiae bacterium]|nr:hypothetical protein [Verrucomicrobiae bacterium]
MKKNNLVLKFFLAGGIVTASASAQDGTVSDSDLLAIGILPSTIPVLDGSEPEVRPIAAGETNPFSERVVDTPQVAVQTESEEMKIGRLIKDMPVHGGLMKRPGGPKILLGDLILQKGALVPQILENQTEQLVVRELDDESIELAFLETPDYKGPPRVIVIPLDIRPTVGQVLPGGSQDLVVYRGRDEMAAEDKLAAVLASRATGGSIGTILPGITVNGKTAKVDKANGLKSLLRSYGQPNANGITGKPLPTAQGALPEINKDGTNRLSGTPREMPASAGRQGATGSVAPFDFGGFNMSPAEGSPEAPETSAANPATQPRATAPARNSAPELPSFTN